MGKPFFHNRERKLANDIPSHMFPSHGSKATVQVLFAHLLRVRTLMIRLLCEVRQDHEQQHGTQAAGDQASMAKLHANTVWRP